MLDKKLFEESLIHPLSFWGVKTKSEVKHLLGDEVAQMVKFDQKNPHHCYDLFFHTLHTVQSIDISAPVVLRIAAFFHDIGKPYVAQEKQGKLTFYNHAQKSSEIAATLLYQFGYTQSQIDEICFYICHHDDFISWVLPSESYDHTNPHLVEITAKNIIRHIEKVEKENKLMVNIKSYKLWSNLLLLCRADISAQAEYVYKDGIIINSKEHKLQQVETIESVISEVFSQTW